MDRASRAQALASALRYLQTERWSFAEAEARALAASSRDDAEAWLLVGLAIAGSGDASRAALVLDRVSRLRPLHAHPCQDFASLQPPRPASQVKRQYRACLRLAPYDGRLRRDDAQLAAEMLLSMLAGVDRVKHLFGLGNGGEHDTRRAARIVDCFLRAYKP